MDERGLLHGIRIPQMPLARSVTRDERQGNQFPPRNHFQTTFFFFSSLNDPALVARGCSFSVICHFLGMGSLDMGVRIRIIIDHELNDACTGRIKWAWVAEGCVNGTHPFVCGLTLGEFSLQISF